MADDLDWAPNGVRVLERFNGTAAPPPERPNPLRREKWVDMGDLYPGHQVLLRFNPNKRGITKLPDDATEDDKIKAGLKRIVLAHRVHFDDGTPDGPWIDPDTDQPMPSPSTDEFWELLPQDLFLIIMGHLGAEGKKVQTSVEQISGLSIESSPPSSGSLFPSGTPGA